jgi:hypothetical protein
VGGRIVKRADNRARWMDAILKKVPSWSTEDVRKMLDGLSAHHKNYFEQPLIGGDFEVSVIPGGLSFRRAVNENLEAVLNLNFINLRAGLYIEAHAPVVTAESRATK